MASTSITIAGTGANDTAVGTKAWTNPGNITADDGTRASLFIDFFGTSNETNYIKATNFGFAIPSGATIDGIEMTVQMSNDASNPRVIDKKVRIVKGGTVGSTDKSNGTGWPANTETTRTYGSSSDLWGETWSYSDINASNFGIVMSFSTNDLLFNITIQIDYIALKIYYTEGGGGGGSTATNLLLLGVG